MSLKKRLSAIVASAAVLCVTLCCTIHAPEGTMVLMSQQERPTATTTTQTDVPMHPQTQEIADGTVARQEEAEESAESIENTVCEAATDTDDDGVEDGIEMLFGTDTSLADTDGDGLSDELEIFVLASDPLSTDGDGNGVQDADEDGDGDRLTNAEELEAATDPAKKDSDSDGVLDGEELTVYASDPLVYDSDADGVNDGYEIELGTDPVTPQERFDVIKVYEGEIVTADVAVNLAGEQVETLCVGPTASDRLLPQEMPGLLAEACDISLDGELQNATLSFAVSMGEEVVEPTVYYYSEATQTLEAVETVVTDEGVTATVHAAGTYVLLDRAVYDASFVWEDTWGTSALYGGAEVVLVVDDSGSMKRSDPDGERLTVARDLIDRLPDGARVGVVRVSSQATALTESLTDDREAAKAALTTDHFVSEGNTAMYGGISQALMLLADSRVNAQKVMIVLSDGFPTDYALYEETVAATQQSGVQTYTVMLGTERMNTVHSLIEYGETVGSVHYTSQTANELSVVYDDIGRLVDITTDTDGDTIPDYYEDNMVAFNGVKIALDKTKADTDGDGLADNEEVSVELILSEDGSQVCVTGKLLSDPSFSDTDGDGDPDSTDAAPYDNTFTGTYTSTYATSGVSFVMDFTRFLGDNTVYDPTISKASAVFSGMAYAENTLTLSDSSGNKTLSTANLTDVLAYFGMENAASYSLSEDYNDIHLSEVAVGYRTICEGDTPKTILSVVVRGTNSTLAEWSSNCDIGDIVNDIATDDWVNTDNHKGFDIAATRIMRFVEQYIAEHQLYEETLIYWVTGHSRGAGIANILGANLEKAGRTAFTYTFAAPNATLAADAASYKTIFNIINKDDFVPCLPIAAWGYTCYGTSTTAVSIRDSYEKVWESHTGISDYNSDGNNMDSCVAALGGILTTGMDPRVDCYRYTCACHGDGTNDTITIRNNGMSESSREKAIAKIPSNALSCCIITRYEGGLLHGWDFEVCQAPGYFMQLLAAFMGGEIDAYRFAMELNIADRYENAKTALVAVGISGVEHPHYPETYYVLADNITAANFA